ECHLHVNETLCTVGDAFFGGDIFVNGTIFAQNVSGLNVTIVQCTTDLQCDDSDPCTDDSCLNGFCVYIVPAGQCNANHFCSANEVCNTTSCLCKKICDINTCNSFPCEVRTCVDGECVFLHQDIGCCTSNLDCESKNQCEKSFCVNNECNGTSLKPGAECSADHFCTSNEICNLTSCECVPICDQNDCNSFPCEVFACIDGLCIQLHEIVGCCQADFQCNDSNPCTNNSCINNECVTTVEPGDCNGNEFCTSNEICNLTTCQCQSTCEEFTCNTFPCQVRTCSDGECIILHRDIGCCTSDLDCIDFNACTLDRCSLSNECRHLPSAGQCAHDADCGSGEICLSNCSCIQFIPDAGECLTSSDCNDNCTCTLDLCNKKCECEFIPLPGCCKNNSDCVDLNECHTDFTCNTQTGLCSFSIRDDDNDNVPCDVDCDDIDNGIGVARTWYRDQDGDGDGCLSLTRISCNDPSTIFSLFSETGTDCDDMNPLVFAGSTVCNITDLQNHFKLLPPQDERDPNENFGTSVAIHKDTIV
ncbi:hypothetical protein LCGC14_2409590, partial [marine sediment metagenome]